MKALHKISTGLMIFFLAAGLIPLSFGLEQFGNQITYHEGESAVIILFSYIFGYLFYPTIFWGLRKFAAKQIENQDN